MPSLVGDFLDFCPLSFWFLNTVQSFKFALLKFRWKNLKRKTPLQWVVTFFPSPWNSRYANWVPTDYLCIWRRFMLISILRKEKKNSLIRMKWFFLWTSWYVMKAFYRSVYRYFTLIFCHFVKWEGKIENVTSPFSIQPIQSLRIEMNTTMECGESNRYDWLLCLSNFGKSIKALKMLYILNPNINKQPFDSTMESSQHLSKPSQQNR